MEMNKSRGNDKHVEDLVTLELRRRTGKTVKNISCDNIAAGQINKKGSNIKITTDCSYANILTSQTLKLVILLKI